MKKYIVRLSNAERSMLTAFVGKGKAAAHKIRHANILLMTDASEQNWSDEKISEAFGCHVKTVCNVRQRFVEQGLEAALNRKKRLTPPIEAILDGAKEAKLIAVACGPPPQGRARWTLALLADRLVELRIVESVSASTLCRTLKKTNYSHTVANTG